MAVILDFQGIKTVTRLVDHLSMFWWCDSNFRNELVAAYSKRVPNNEIWRLLASNGDGCMDGLEEWCYIQDLCRPCHVQGSLICYQGSTWNQAQNLKPIWSGNTPIPTDRHHGVSARDARINGSLGGGSLPTSKKKLIVHFLYYYSCTSFGVSIFYLTSSLKKNQRFYVFAVSNFKVVGLFKSTS